MQGILKLVFIFIFDSNKEKEAELLAEDPEYATKGDSTPAILTTAPSRTATPADQAAGGLAPTDATVPVDDPIKREDLLEGQSIFLPL